MGIFNDTITIYNHKEDDSYQRTVVRGVMYSSRTEKTVTADGKINLATTVSVTIPETAVCNRRYVTKREFKVLTDTSECWTLNESDNLDVIVWGAVEQELTEDYRLKHLKADYDCVTVAAIEDNRNKPRLKHIKVVCK